MLSGIALARLAVRLARDVEPLEPEPALVPAGSVPANQPYLSAVDESSPETAVTRPRAQHFPPSEAAPPAESRWRSSFRRQSAGGPGAQSNAYLRWPPPQQ